MEPIRRREIFAAGIIALTAGLIVASPVFDRIRGVSLDILTALRWQAFGVRHDPAASPSVVVAIDEESYHTPPFDGTPTIAWTREIGRVLSAIVDGGAKVVGFDIVFPTSIEQSEIPFGDETFGSRVRGFDRDFLRALALAALSDKVVLGQFQRGDKPIRPSAAQLIAVGQQRNVRALNAHSDNDNTIRRMPLTLMVDDKVVTSMSAELASRALGANLAVEANGKMTLGDYRIPISVPNTVTLNFEGGADDIPTYSLADLRNCAEKGDVDFFRRNFSGKVVIIGSLLENEDLKITSKRFATGSEGARAPRCTSSVPRANPALKGNWISGAYIHATAVNNLIRRDAIVEVGRVSRGAIGVAAAALTILVAFIFTPVGAALAYLIMNALWAAIATLAFNHSVALPLVEPFAAGFIALVAMIGFRFVVSDKDKRFLRRSFAYYLAPAVIEKMLASNVLPVLGGELRVITVYFSDIAGFSSFSEKLRPHELVNLMNQYLSAMTNIIEDHGGFVDKYIGDAIVAVFGAPLDDPRHAHHAVRAALRCQERLAELRQEPLFKQFDVSQRIGLNSGEALVGNIGSHRRFNYTVMGDTVNLASRLEGANKFFGTSIMASDATVALTAFAFVWRELDAIRVKGRNQPVRIYEPFAETERTTTDQHALAACYARGLAHWRAREFAAARDHFAKIAKTDPAAAHFLDRANEFAKTPPGPAWEPVNTLEGK
jgi:adenylate cyclase